MNNKWLDGTMGLVVGDALGVPVEFKDRHQIESRENGFVTSMESGGTYGLPAGTWSDDSSMALATLSSIIDCKAINPVDIMERFVDWKENAAYTPYGEVFDIGNTCFDAICNYSKNKDIKTCGATDKYSNGNGSLMRILPVCIWCYEKCDNDAEAIDQVHLISGLTHNHLLSKMACGFYYLIIKAILDNKKCDANNVSLQDIVQSAIDKAFEFYNGKDQLAHFSRIRDLSEFRQLPYSDIKSGGYVIESVEASIWCLVTTDSYEKCVLEAVNLGHDTDTTAAIAGGLAGLHYGFDSIPKDWVKEIEKHEWIEKMCEEAQYI